jgi:hypothetical protein
MSFTEVALWFFELLLLISLFGLLEHLICETLESVAVPGLVLSLGMENANAIQEAFKFTQLGPVLLRRDPLCCSQGAQPSSSFCGPWMS